MKSIVVLAVMCYILGGHAAPAASELSGRVRPRPLDNADTWNNLMVMAENAQSRDKDHETRLIPVIPNDELKEWNVCCINAKILDYYLDHILHTTQVYPRIDRVKPDLKRVARDLEPHCNKPTFHDHEITKKFKRNYTMIKEIYSSVQTAENKAIGEIDILFHYLYESCNSS